VKIGGVLSSEEADCTTADCDITPFVPSIPSTGIFPTLAL